METNIGVKMVVSARTAASLFLRSGMFIVNFVIITKFPLVLCVLKTVKMICNSNVYLINQYAFVLRPALEFTTENFLKHDLWFGWSDHLLQLRQKERLYPIKYF
jgi:hypothetical protein